MPSLYYSDANGTHTLILPDTLGYDLLAPELDLSAERAPYSYQVVVAGDGLPKPTPIKIKGKAYFGTANDAQSWLNTLLTVVDEVTGAKLDDNVITVLAADVVAIPTNLPRVLNVTITLYPEAN